MNYKITLAYDGSRYMGWQRLKDDNKTIQGKVEEMLSTYFQVPIHVIGSGRTDRGVHALGQVANVHLPLLIEKEELRKIMNHYLPEDIRVLHVEGVEEDFHARFHAKDKTYEYRLVTREVCSPFIRKYVLHAPGSYNFKEMEKGAQALLGNHDFTSFTNRKGKKSNSRTLYDIKIIPTADGFSIQYRGDGFLHNMIRIMTGTLLSIGRGEESADVVPQMLEAKKRAQAGDMVPGQGLFLIEVTYDQSQEP